MLFVFIIGGLLITFFGLILIIELKETLSDKK